MVTGKSGKMTDDEMIQAFRGTGSVDWLGDRRRGGVRSPMMSGPLHLDEWFRFWFMDASGKTCVRVGAANRHEFLFNAMRLPGWMYDRPLPISRDVGETIHCLRLRGDSSIDTGMEWAWSVEVQATRRFPLSGVACCAGVRDGCAVTHAAAGSRGRSTCVLLIIENKVVGGSPEAEQQVEAYQKVFREKYKGRYDHFPGVLLTTSNSPGGSGAECDVIHVSWNDVRGLIRSLLNDRENLTDGYVRAFVEQYLEVIEERLVQAGGLAERLLKDHEQVFLKLQKEPALLDKVDAPRRAAVERLMEYFQQRPARLRSEVEDYLKRRGGAGTRKTGRTGGTGGGWLHWYGMPFGSKLNVDDCAWWVFTFEPRNVSVELGRWSSPAEQNSNMEEIWRFLQETPIDPGRPEKYPMEKGVIYRQSLLYDDELSGSFEESVKLLHRRMDGFFRPGGDYERMEHYFKCLAFDPRGPQASPGRRDRTLTNSPAQTALGPG